MKPREQFIEMYESFFKEGTCKQAYTKAALFFHLKHEYHLYTSYESFKANLHKYRLSKVTNLKSKIN